MVELLLTHLSKSSNRESIQEKGILQHTPHIDGNYQEALYLKTQPKGVYVCLDETGKELWRGKSTDDQWTFSWTGSMKLDPFLGHQGDVFVIEQDIPAEKLCLAQEGKPCTI